MRTVTISVTAPDVKDIQPLVADLIREMWIEKLTVKFNRVSNDSIKVSDNAWTLMQLINTDPYISLSTQ